MIIPGLAEPRYPGDPLPWTWVDGPPPMPGVLFAADGAPIAVHCWKYTGRLLAAAPDLAAGLVVSTEALVFALRRYEPDTDPMRTAAVGLALAALAKADGRKAS